MDTVIQLSPTPKPRTKKSPSERLSDLKRRLSIIPEPYDSGNGWSKYDKEIQDRDNKCLSPNCVIVKTEILVSTQQISNSEDLSQVELSTEGSVTTLVPEHDVYSAIDSKRNSAILNTDENDSHKRKSKLDFFKQTLSLTKFQSTIKQFVDNVGSQSR
ncbi:3787_t:CDS:1, partial [Cetraspora pellucida]